MRFHFIAIGGSAMHNLALAMNANGHMVTGSDDEIYEPSLSRLRNEGICPPEFGWHPDKITKDIDVIILGMHARKDNPELIQAQKLGLSIMSYPEFIYSQSKEKKRIVIAGSHGKTTTTSIIIHVLNYLNMDCDYLVGAQLEGFDRMVRISSSSLMVIEGDEYLSSPLDSSSKFSHYKPHISVITGISWDHINVFPTEEEYIDRFRSFIQNHGEGQIFYCGEDVRLAKLVATTSTKAKKSKYLQLEMNSNRQVVVDGVEYEYNLIGGHNLENTSAALKVCQSLGIENDDFFKALLSFKGAGKRLQNIFNKQNAVGFLDFAHAPSKVEATTKAIKEWYPKLKLVAVLELHTFSSLNKAFIPMYKGTMAKADQAIVYYDAHTLNMKRMEPLDKEFVQNQFSHPNLSVYDDQKEFHAFLDTIKLEGVALLLMSSGNLGNYDLNKLNRWS